MTEVESLPRLSHSSGCESDLSDSSPPTPISLQHNSEDPSVTWLVQKYGGTSVGKFAAAIAEEIVPYVLVNEYYITGFYGSQSNFCLVSHIFYCSSSVFKC